MLLQAGCVLDELCALFPGTGAAVPYCANPWSLATHTHALHTSDQPPLFLHPEPRIGSQHSQQLRRHRLATRTHHINLPPHGCKRVIDPNLLSVHAQAPECTSIFTTISSASHHLARACSTPCSLSHCKTAAGRQWPAGTALPSRGSTQGWCCLLPCRCSQFRSPWCSVMAVNTATPK